MPVLPRLDSDEMEMLLGVTRLLATPFELQDMLAQVTEAACRVLHAERSSVWLLDPTTGDLVLETANGLDQARIPVGDGLIGACALEEAVRPIEVASQPGDCLVLLSDGVYEWADAAGRMYGRGPVERLVRAGRDVPLRELSARLLHDLHAFAGATVQEDDITMVLVRRNPEAD